MRFAYFGLSSSAAALVGMALSACAPEPARAPHEMRPVAEENAAAIIDRTFRTRDVVPERDRVVHLSREKQIHLEVAAAEHKFGVAYVTDADAEQLGEVIPHRPRGSDALVVLRGEQGSRILVLFERDYVQDDGEGEEHTRTTIAAQRKLERDVRDFLHKAKAERWP